LILSVIEFEPPPPPPRKGDVLFRDDLPDWPNNACLNSTFGDDQLAYTEGYRRGANRLLRHVIEEQTDQDFLLYPIIFLYRHHIELILKRLIVRAPYLIDRELTETEKKHLGGHRLDLLWQDLKPMFTQICEAAGWGRPNQDDIDGIEDYIRQMVKLDPESFTFRYARSKKGDPSLPADLKRINLRHFGEVMERLASHLDGIDSATSHIEEVKLEMEAEWRSEMAAEMASYMDYYDGY
jgi:hypothetical protein